MGDGLRRGRELEEGRQAGLAPLAQQALRRPDRLGRVDAIRSASRRLAAISSGPGTTYETSPQASASCAETASPVSAILQAFDQPTIRGSSQAPPSPGMVPIFTKLSAKRAVSARMRRSHMQARSLPAPIAGPLTAASRACRRAARCAAPAGS
ncbi:hypothetical protein Maq22A_1p38385 (plasmid) [Methylobacterium aquaticum]|uniref:Uncharacterized protein n=1 Tax=Methylobacterium aquaticum TaxID=270351 RepID=A0A1Y0ZH18_9HYPH|nr:hypothetical protein Maq22A_1p38385 [Methylobacterium aquaticum]